VDSLLDGHALMPSSFTHAIAGAALASPLAKNPVPRRFWVAAAICGALPDIDLLWGRNVPSGSWPAHRGVTHSLAFAVLLGAAATALCFRDPRFAPVRWRYMAALVLATASHGFLDSLAVYGSPVAFFFPFTTHRYLLPWRIFGSQYVPWPRSTFYRVLRVVKNEVLWVWLPSLVLLVTTAVRRRLRSRIPG
jgi:inner membrane protein